MFLTDFSPGSLNTGLYRKGFPYNEIFDPGNLLALSDDKSNLAQELISVLEMAQFKKKSAKNFDFQQFFLFQQFFRNTRLSDNGFTV